MPITIGNPLREKTSIYLDIDISHRGALMENLVADTDN